MRVINLIENRNHYLYEGLENAELRSVKLWESAGYAIREAALTPDQIQSLFSEIEKGATAAGGNRTMLGKGKDATVAVKKAYDDLVTKVQTSGPVKGADAMYDSAVAKIEAGLGGPDNAVNKVIQKYRKFAKEHPVAQGLIYSILIAAAGISGVGLGGAAVLGLLKMTDKLLQGEKFSTAVGKGLATGATAYAAGQIGQALKGTPQDAPGGGSTWADKQYDKLAGQHADAAVRVGGRAARDAIAKGALDSADEFIKSGAITDYNSIGDAVGEIMSRYEGTAKISAQSLQSIEQMVRTKLMASMVDGNGIIRGGKAVAKGVASAAVGDSIIYTGKKLSEGQVYMVINRVCARQLDEGVWDSIKGAAAKGMDKLKTVGKNLTTTVTADKLNSAWQKAGSPTDSEELKQFLTAQGVEAGIIDSVYKTLKISSGAAEEPAAQSMYAQIKKDVQTLDKKSRQRIMTYLQKQLGTA
jgi:hypothetical protein